jgi:Zn-dependent peptidase ImmA (M78 family)
MPAALLKAQFAETPSAAALANEFGVSKAAMEIRLKTLGLG